MAAPLKIIVIGGQREYCKSVWCAIGVGLTQVMVGAVNMTFLLYHLHSGDSHVLLYGLGFHFFCVEAILSLNHANGWSTPLSLRHRKCTHIVLQLCCLIMVICGMLLTNTSGSMSSLHAITGLIAFIGVILNVVIGPMNFVRNNEFSRIFRIAHLGIGIVTFIAAIISTISGMFLNSFNNWIHTSALVVLLSFIVFYTTFILILPFLNFVSKF